MGQGAAYGPSGRSPARFVRVDGAAVSARIRKIVVEVSVPAGAFDEIEDTVRHGPGDAVEAIIDFHLGNARNRRAGDVGQRANRERPLIVVLVTVKDEGDAVIL